MVLCGFTDIIYPCSTNKPFERLSFLFLYILSISTMGVTRVYHVFVNIEIVLGGYIDVSCIYIS